MSCHRSYRRILFASAALAVLVAVVLATSVIPPVSADTYPGASSSAAIPAFWIITAVNLVAAGVLFKVARTSERGGRRVVTGVAGVVVLLLALALADAGGAYKDHGPGMSLAATLLLVCAAAEVVAGALVLIATLLPRRVRTGPN